MKAEAATAREQVAPLAARVKELEEELTRAAGERDALLSRADEALKAAEASRVDALAWKEKYKGELCSLYFACFFLCSAPNSQCGTELEKEASWAAEASQVEVQHWKGRAEASQVEVQHWKEKTKGEFRWALPISGLFFFLA